MYKHIIWPKLKSEMYSKIWKYLLMYELSVPVPHVFHRSWEEFIKTLKFTYFSCTNIKSRQISGWTQLCNILSIHRSYKNLPNKYCNGCPALYLKIRSIFIFLKLFWALNTVQVFYTLVLVYLYCDLPQENPLSSQVHVILGKCDIFAFILYLFDIS